MICSCFFWVCLDSLPLVEICKITHVPRPMTPKHMSSPFPLGTRNLRKLREVTVDRPWPPHHQPGPTSPAMPCANQPMTSNQDEIKGLFKKLKEVKVDRKCDAFIGVQVPIPGWLPWGENWIPSRKTNISHLGKRKIIFKIEFSGVLFVSRRVVKTCHGWCSTTLAGKNSQDVVKKWTVFCPLVGELRDPAMRQRHWAQLMDQKLGAISQGQPTGPYPRAPKQ